MSARHRHHPAQTRTVCWSHCVADPGQNCSGAAHGGVVFVEQLQVRGRTQDRIQRRAQGHVRLVSAGPGATMSPHDALANLDKEHEAAWVLVNEALDRLQEARRHLIQTAKATEQIEKALVKDGAT